MEPFAQVEDVQNRMDFDLDDAERTAVYAALQDMSDEARYYGGREWDVPEAAPRMVRITVLKAVSRWAKNMHGYTLSRAGDEQVQWKGGEPVPQFTAAEIKLLKAIGDERLTPAFGTVELYAYTDPEKTVDDGTVGATVGGQPFPFNLENGRVW